MQKILFLVFASALVAVAPQAMADDAPAEAAKTGTATQQPASPNSGQAAPSEQGKATAPTSSGSDQPLCIQQ